jgi:4'-phosphopantetheinyl transferase
MKMDTIHPVIMAVPTINGNMTRKEKVAALSRLARRALQFSAEYSGVLLEKELEKNDLGAPVPQKGIHWSISHKEHYVAGVTANHPVGIDIEMIKPFKEALFKRIAEDSEWALAPEKNRVLFIRVWTAKEAVLKAIGKGMTALAGCRITQIPNDSQMRLSAGGSQWMVTHFRVTEEYLAAVTARDGEVISWHRIDGFNEK